MNNIPYVDNDKKAKLAKPFILGPHLALLLDSIAAQGGKGILVGGCVRDHLLGHRAKDIDIEVYGLDNDALEKILHARFSVVAVGKTFGIYKVTVTIEDERESFDVALPRRENKEGFGHKGFVITTDPFLSFSDASSRRDFTINAMGIDPVTNEIYDPHGGRNDLDHHVLRHVSDAFKEDPLRVLRAAQFCARFQLTLAKDTILLCQSLVDELRTLSRERIFEEMKKLLLASKPSRGLEVLRETFALRLFPELEALIDCKQDQEWHPEGDVWVHSLMVADQAASITRMNSLDEEATLIVMAGALCHDLGKPKTTILKDGRIKSPAHEQEGEEPTRLFLDKIGFPKKFHDQVVALVKEHLKPHQLYSKRDEVSDGAIRRLASRVHVPHLLLVSQADFLGRTTADAVAGHDPSAPWLKQKIENLLGTDLTPKPILLGRHLIALGEKPGTGFSDILRAAFEAQMDGEFVDEESGVEWLKRHLKERLA